MEEENGVACDSKEASGREMGGMEMVDRRQAMMERLVAIGRHVEEEAAVCNGGEASGGKIGDGRQVMRKGM